MIRKGTFGTPPHQGGEQKDADMEGSEMHLQGVDANHKRMSNEKQNNMPIARVPRAIAGDGTPGLQNSSQQETQEEKEAKMEERIIRQINGGVQTDLIEHRKRMQEDIKSMISPLIEMMNQRSLANLLEAAPSHNHLGSTNQQPLQERQAAAPSEDQPMVLGMQTITEGQNGDAEPAQSMGEENQTGMEPIAISSNGVQEAISSIEKGNRRMKARNEERRSRDEEEGTQTQERERSRSPISEAVARKPNTEEE